jgi:hypothetical protein
VLSQQLRVHHGRRWNECGARDLTIRNANEQIEQPSVSTKSNDVLTAALSYAGRGWHVIPLHNPTQDGCSCKSQKCHSVGKHPRTRHGLKDASTNTNQIRKWFEAWPDANVGIVTGKESGLVVLDVDDKDERKGSDTLTALLEANDDAPTTMIVRTGNGRHIYYRHPGGTLKNSAGQLGVGLDIRADGGYVVAAPSRHANGEIYTIEQNLEVEQLPVWLLAMIDGRTPNIYAIEEGVHYTIYLVGHRLSREAATTNYSSSHADSVAAREWRSAISNG